ncbi:MAG: type II toxin-antitoxin system ParD family antitoxin [Candidatus Hydrogenedentes bacterium]|nr:type II toxin-antitoxin system ParD family antitoxin [Candidatus Hydrogenedentota bacterium]
MTTMNVSLPDPMRSFIEDLVSQGRYGSASEYIRELIRNDQQRQAQLRIETLLLEGLDSGEGIEITAEWWRKKRAELNAKTRGKKGR